LLGRKYSLKNLLTNNKIRNILLKWVIYYVFFNSSPELLTETAHGLNLEVDAMDTVEKQKYIFGNIFLIANRLQVLGDKYLESDGMTTKQWLLTVMISQFQDNPPTLSEVAKLMGSSRQNVKQLALKLEEKGFLNIQKDKQDARALRLKLTEKSRTFWEERQNQDEEYLENLFKDFSNEEIDIIFKGFEKLSVKIEELDALNAAEDVL